MVWIPPEIADQIVAHLYQESLAKLKDHQRDEELDDRPLRRTSWNYTLLCLRRVSKSFRAAVDRVLFRDFTIDKLSSQSLVKTKTLLDCPSICSAVRTYTLSPKVCLVRPIVKRNEWAYYGEFADECGGREPRYSYLKSVHAMRQKVAQHYDEQLRLMKIDGWTVDWLWFGLERFLRGAQVCPQTTNLKTLPYFSSVAKLSNLRELRIGYSIPQSRQDTRLHYLIKNDMTAGLAAILLHAPPHLDSIRISFMTLTDVRNLVYFIDQEPSTTLLRQIKSLEISLTEETLGHRGRSVDKDGRIHGHTAGGKPIADLLNIFPDLQGLKLTYYQAFHDSILILQNFSPASLKGLKELHLETFAIDPIILLSMMDWRSSSAQNPRPSFNVRNLALFNKGPSWLEIFRVGHEKGCFGPISGSSHGFVIRGPLRYLNRNICTDEALSDLRLHDTKILDELTDVETKSLNNFTSSFQYRSYWPGSTSRYRT